MSQLNYLQATWETASVDDWSAFNLSYSGSNPFSTETYLDPYIGSYGQMQADAYLNGAKVQASLNADSASKFSSDTVGAYTSFAFRLQSVNLRDGAANFNTGNAYRDGPVWFRLYNQAGTEVTDGMSSPTGRPVKMAFLSVGGTVYMFEGD